jgi:nucleoside 2-deoxyribosyltransferase
MKIYIASHDPELAREQARKLVRLGHTITSRWHDGRPFLKTDEYTEQERRKIAFEDWHDVTEADALLLIAGPDKYSGGKFVEAGIAIGQGKAVYVLGRRENMLMWHPICLDASLLLGATA